MKRMGLLLALLVPFVCNSQESKIYATCAQHATTQSEMNVCAAEEAERADAELNRVYKLLISKAQGDTLSVAKIKTAQEAWIAYRDAYIEATYPAKNKQTEYGSMYPLEVNLLTAKITRQQTRALRDILKHY